MSERYARDKSGRAFVLWPILPRFDVGLSGAADDEVIFVDGCVAAVEAAVACAADDFDCRHFAASLEVGGTGNS